MSLCNERAALSYMGNESRRYYGCQLINSPPSRNARNGLPLCGRVHLYMYNCVSVGPGSGLYNKEINGKHSGPILSATL